MERGGHVRPSDAVFRREFDRVVNREEDAARRLVRDRVHGPAGDRDGDEVGEDDGLGDVYVRSLRPAHGLDVVPRRCRAHREITQDRSSMGITTGGSKYVAPSWATIWMVRRCRPIARFLLGAATLNPELR